MIEQVFRTATLTDANAVSWTIDGGGDWELYRLTFAISVIPTTAGVMTITLDSAQGAAFDCILGTIDPVDLNTTDLVSVVGAGKYQSGDKVVITYTNADSRTINATALYGI